MDNDNTKENPISQKEQINDEEFELFQNVLSKDLVLELYSIFKLFEKKGLINYNIYMECMTQIFKKYSNNDNHDYKNIFNLIFNRYQKIKCIMKNDKKVFYLTKMLLQNKIETYIIVCFLTIFIKCRIVDKIKLLFELTDIDDDGFLNKKEIKQMITTINFMFCEENSLININSSILAQSLMNLKVKEKLDKLMNDPGNLNIELEKEKYISFFVFYNSLIKIKNYKYEIIPCFINMKQCLYNKRKEKIIEIKNKHKKEFVRASSALSFDKPCNPYKRFKRNFSANNLGRIIKNVKINNDNSGDLNLMKKKQLLLGIKEKTKSFKELLKESTIFSDDDDILEGEGSATRVAGGGQSIKENISEERIRPVTSSFKRISFHSNNKNKDKPLYIFEADFDKIKKIEVQPALLKFSKKEEEKKDDEKKENKEKTTKKKFYRYNSTLNIKSKDININNNYQQNLVETIDIYKKKLSSNNSFNMNINKTLFSTKKRASIIPITFKHKLVNNFNLNKDQTFNYYSNLFNKGNNRINRSNCNLIKINNKDHTINNINTSKNKCPSTIKKNKQNKIRKKNVKDTENKYHIKKNKLLNNFSTNNMNKRNINKIMSRNKKNMEQKKKADKYLSANDIFKDVDKHEEKLRHERTEYYGKELISLYKKMLKEKKEIRQIIGKYDKYDISLNFFDFKKKGFPKDFGKSIFSYNKYY